MIKFLLRCCRPHRIRLSLLFITLLASHLLIPGIRRLGRWIRRPKKKLSWSPGISLIIPERAGKDILKPCLESVFTAVKRCGPHEPWEVIVVVNGSPPSDYTALSELFPAVRWLFYARPLGFSRAVSKGLAAASCDWVYLLNNDMTLDPDALKEVIKWRAPSVFAVASQIFFTDPNRRREETGWTDMRATQEGIEIFDVLPEDRHTVRGSLYAGGGASLFNKRILQRLMSWSDPYRPFYWEDADWGVRAWAMGYEVLFCPSSTCRHRHRTTVSKFYPSVEIDRIFRRNSIQFELRNLMDICPPRQRIQLISRLDAKTQREMGHPINCLSLLLARIRMAFAPFHDIPLTHVRRKVYPVPCGLLKPAPRLIIVSPYALYPPAHGGAVRITRLIRELSRSFHIILLSDEAELYPRLEAALFPHLISAHLVSGRIENNSPMPERIRRIKSHSHTLLRRELARLIQMHRPKTVQVEYVELAGLFQKSSPPVQWVLALHDVLCSAPGAPPNLSDRYEKALTDRFDAVTVCSREDAELLDHASVTIVPNGADVDSRPYIPSGDSPSILFPGPFRYPPNLRGICIFLERVYPRLLQKVPDLSIVILGGTGARELGAPFDCLHQKGVRLIDTLVKPEPFLEKCAVTINPLYGIRGSSIKLIESLAAGRICVSTREGARGFYDAGFPGLIIKNTIEAFTLPLETLLLDKDKRHSLEPPPVNKLKQYSWRHSARRLKEIYERAG